MVRQKIYFLGVHLCVYTTCVCARDTKDGHLTMSYIHARAYLKGGVRALEALADLVVVTQGGHLHALLSCRSVVGACGWGCQPGRYPKETLGSVVRRQQQQQQQHHHHHQERPSTELTW